MNIPAKRFGNIGVYKVLMHRGWVFGVRVSFVCEGLRQCDVNLGQLSGGIVWKGANLSAVYTGFTWTTYGSPIADNPVVDIWK